MDEAKMCSYQAGLCFLKQILNVVVFEGETELTEVNISTESRIIPLGILKLLSSGNRKSKIIR